MAQKCVVGLGNPGSRYELTRHNLGFMVVDRLARLEGLSWRREAFPALGARGFFAGHEVLLVKPQTYMNNSGQCMAPLLEQYALEDILVVYDDMDLDLGRLRLRAKGSAGTHKGMGSVVKAAGEMIPRLRLGIGPPLPTQDPVDFVISPFRPDEIVPAREMVDRAAEAVRTWIAAGIEEAMLRYNG
ncbi:MAG: aminoacyl-tRNA hydrolase [Firmicutes bacterium]|nr:aminoacyl-tRNA hydrolase [Bacillota bacterium]